MKVTRTYLDAGVLIAAARGTSALSRRAFAILADPAREFCVSVFLELELVPKAVFTRRRIEETFYREYFHQAKLWAHDLDLVVGIARQEAQKCGLAALDALHVGAARATQCDELITTESSTKVFSGLTW